MIDKLCANCQKIKAFPAPDIEINRKALDIIEEIEKQLQTFRGFRKMWAATSAGGSIYYGIPDNILLDSQKEALGHIVYHSLRLHDKCWNTDSVPHAHYAKDNAKTAYQDEVELQLKYGIAIEDAIQLLKNNKIEKAIELLIEVIK